MSAPDRIWVEKSIAEKGNHGSTAWHNTDEDSDIEYTRADLCDPQDARVQALEAENARLRRAADVAATIANGALDPTAREATLRRDLSRVRDYLRAALPDLEGGKPDVHFKEPEA